jgi:phosphoribosylcarboxyaminoimidazole (NCAIR) mutase
LATVQMPPRVPVATVAVDGSLNAGLLAAQILGVSDPEIAEKLAARKEEARTA